jgi:hypothetical protein
MITHNEQLDLLSLISKEIGKDIDCYAFGGTAMMFYGYKDQTKDIDLSFIEGREIFIDAIQRIGFEETSPMTIYIPEKLRDKNRPLMFKRGDIRFDLFSGKIFHTVISPRMKEDLFGVSEFRGKKTLRVKALRKEHIVQLKSITERDKDFEDILTIIRKDKSFDWQYLVEETIWQHKHGDSWALVDVLRVMKELKEYVFIEEKYFTMLERVKEPKNL